MKLMLTLLSLVALNQVGYAAGTATSVDFKLLSFNIDTNILRTEEGYARDSYPEWRVGRRMPKLQSAIVRIVDKYKPDVIHIQEARDFVTKFGDHVNSVDPLVDTLRALDYHVSTIRYNPSDRAFSYITAIRPSLALWR